MKKIGRRNKIKAILAFILYISLIIFQSAYLIPYTVTRTYVSEQNVPHTVIIGKEYSDYDCTWRDTDKSGNVTSKMIDRPALMIQFVITTLAAFLFYHFIRTKENTNLQDLEKKISELTEYKNHIESVISSLPDEKPPTPRLNYIDMCFRSEEENEKEIIRYTKSVSCFVKYEIGTALRLKEQNTTFENNKVGKNDNANKAKSTYNIQTNNLGVMQNFGTTQEIIERTKK